MFFKLPGTVLFFFIYFFFVSPILMAQDSLAVELPAQWSLQQCFDYAMKNNIQLNSLRLSRLSSGQDLLLSKAAKLPDLAWSASQSLNGGKTLTDGGNTPYKVYTSGN